MRNSMRNAYHSARIRVLAMGGKPTRRGVAYGLTQPTIAVEDQLRFYIHLNILTYRREEGMHGEPRT